MTIKRYHASSMHQACQCGLKSLSSSSFSIHALPPFGGAIRCFGAASTHEAVPVVVVSRWERLYGISGAARSISSVCTMNSKYVFIYKPLCAFTHAFVLQYFHSYFMVIFCTIDWFRSYSYSLLLKNIQTWSPLGAMSSEGRMPHHSLINGHHRKIPVRPAEIPIAWGNWSDGRKRSDKNFVDIYSKHL